MSGHKPPSTLSRARRQHGLASYDPGVIRDLLDRIPLAHIGHLIDGQPVVTATLQWRMGERIYWHGSSASRMMKAAAGAKVCVTVTAVDGMVLARSGLEHSTQYRSVMVFGEAVALRDPGEKEAALKAMMERLFPGRWDALRPMTAQELKATAVLSLPISEASAKISACDPTDPPEDATWPVWAGVLPMQMVTGPARPAPDLAPGLAAEAPAYLRDFTFG
ncbi:pyridoxamine 5'-phosphate oxidase family protein [Pseudogemmobacter bohemicus]|uniref:pyridoxamine 5'-phosphate oxidase family protein n=1 Tax=Pseudogemmobacter bohemicus TaxID=2250708 RepID=UPI0013002C50|nr:pyridoxamine 5'-phosphate oxidase family protein [Pseudogemmobacter bohemicus]